MGSLTRWSAVAALALGVFAAANSSAADSPLAPKSLRLHSDGVGSALSYDGNRWETAIDGYDRDGLDLIQATYIRGPARIFVTAGTWVALAAGEVVVVSWEPAVRGYRIVGVTGKPIVQFANAAMHLPPGASITLTTIGELYQAPSGYSPSGVIGLAGLPEVSGFRPFEDDVR